MRRPSHLGLKPGDITAIRGLLPKLYQWYQKVARDLPWRLTRDPYAIWVSEVMLQQTQVATVTPYYERWMEALPDCAALARTDQDDVLRLWEGLGYYSRALRLRQAAQQVQQRFEGRIPNTPEELASLPGVGPYTCAAVLSIAYDLPFAAVDGNVRRILARLAATSLDLSRPPASHEAQTLAQELLGGSPGLHNQAVMELGAVVCRPRRPDCGACPLSQQCRGQATGCPEDFPVRPKRRRVPHVHVALGVVQHGEHFFIDRRPTKAMLGGLWEFPGGKLEQGETPRQALVRELREEFGMEVTLGRELPTVRHAYTHLKVTLHPIICDFQSMDPTSGEGRPWRWASWNELGEVAMPRANRRVLVDLASTLRLSAKRFGES